MWPRLLSIGIGLWLVISPAVLNLAKPAADNQHIVGPLVISMGIISISEVMRSLRYVNVLAGGWLLLSVWVLDFHDMLLTGSNIACGVLLIGCSLIRGPLTNRLGGGWRSLLSRHPQHLRNAP